MFTMNAKELNVWLCRNRESLERDTQVGIREIVDTLRREDGTIGITKQDLGALTGNNQDSIVQRIRDRLSGRNSR